MRNIRNKKGMTLIEILLYLAIFSIVIVSVTSFGIKTVDWSKKALSRTLLEEEAVSINRFLNDSFGKAISVDENIGKTVYDNDNGTLVLNLNGSTTDTYLINNGFLFIQRGANAPVSLVGNKVTVSQFKVEKVMNRANVTIGIRVYIRMSTNLGDPMVRNISTSYLIDQK